MDTTLKNKTISGVLWSFVERFGSVLLQFVANIVLARLLLPSDFGLIGLIMVFITISNTFVDGGLGSALIQKTDATEVDYSTIFFLNIIVAFFLCLVIFISASSISSFYHQPQLRHLLQVLSLVLILNALSIIQNVLLIRAINFKRLAFVNVLATFLACILSITAALNGLGVWSLVIQMIAISFFKSLLLWFSSKWRPRFIFNFKSAKKLIDFGYKLLLSGLADSLYVGLYSLVIGKLFTSSDLGFYTQAKKLQDAPAYTLSAVVNQVTFPIFVTLQHDLIALKNGVKSSVVSLAYFNFPLMIMLMVVARPLFEILLTHKWDESIPYFQLLCISGMLLTTHSINLNVLKSLGKTNTFLLSEILKKVVGVALIVVGYHWGMIGIVSSVVGTIFIGFFINGSFSAKAINYGIMEQIRDLLPTLILAISTGLIVFFIFSYFTLSPYALVFGKIIGYLIIYLGVSKLAGLRGYLTLHKIVNEKVFKRI